MKSLMNRTMITSNFKIRSISEKKDSTCPEKNGTDIGAKTVPFTEMRNAVFGVKNDKFSEKDLEELQNKLLSKKNRVRASETDFQKKNNEYESKKNIWKDTKVSFFMFLRSSKVGCVFRRILIMVE